MPRPVAWLLVPLWLAAVGLLARHAVAAGWGPAECLLATAGWLVVPALAAPGEAGRLFGPVFGYEALRLGRRPLTFGLRGLYVVLVMGLLVWLYLIWRDQVTFPGRRQEAELSAGAVAVAGACLAAAGVAGWLLRGWWRRGTLVGLGVMAGVAVLAGSGGGAPVAPGKLAGFATLFFTVFVFVQFAVVGLLTPAYVAGAVADEKERKTLEFLLATDLAPREIIFGKLAARVATLLMYVLAGLPVVAFLQLFGGIDPDLLLAATAAAAVTVLGYACVGVFFSTTLRRPRDAIALTYLLLIAYLIGSVVLFSYAFHLFGWVSRPGNLWTEELFGLRVDMKPVVEWFFVAARVLAAGNVGVEVALLAEPVTGRGGLTPANMAVAMGHYALFWAVAGGAMLLYSVWRLRPIALGHNRVPTQAVIDRQARRRPAVGTDPMLWKEVFLEGGFKGGCVGTLTGLLVLGLVFVWPPVIAYQTFTSPGGARNQWGAVNLWDEFAEGMNAWCRLSTAAVGTLVLLAVAVRAAGAVSGERDRDTWISLTSTPLGAWEMLRGKWLGCVLGLRRGYAVLLAVWAVGLASRAIDPLAVVPAVLTLAVYAGAFAWVGLLCSLTARTTLVATVRAVAAGVTLAGGFWIVFGLCCLSPLAAVGGGRPGNELPGLLELVAGFTPAVVLFWLPVRGFSGHDLEPFDERLGVLNPLVGVVGWAMLGWLAGWVCYTGFRRLTNRGRDDIPTGARPAALGSQPDAPARAL